MRNNFLTQLAATAIVLIAAFPFANTAQAINIGEVVSQSKIGEPLRIQIELTGSGIENVEDACLSLVAPDPDEEGARDYLTAARVAVKTEGQRQFAAISSHKPYNDPFIRLRLRVKCVGVGNVVKSFTILPEFGEVLHVASPGAATKTDGVAASGSFGADRTGQLADQGVSQEGAQPRRSKRKPRAARNARQTSEAATKRRLTAARVARSSQGKEEAFRLRLSSGSVDESRIGKISPEERTQLRARQKLLDADDQMANFLALQDQVRQLQAELGAVKLKLGSLGAGVPAAVSAAPDVAATHAPQQQEAQPTTVAETKPESAPQDQQAQSQNASEQQAQEQQVRKPQPAKQRPEKIRRGPIIFGLLILLGLLFGVRYYLRNRAQSAGTKPAAKKRPVFATEPAAEPAPAPAPAHRPAPAPAFKSHMQTGIAQPGAKPAAKPMAKAAAEKTATPAARADVSKQDEALAFSRVQKLSETVPMAPPAPRERTQEELAEADSIVEEAELYAIHGHPDRAVLILEELIQQHPNKTEAWMLLFSIFSSLKKVAEFEQAAMNFARSNHNSTVWPEIQSLGRALDPGNVMYADFNAAAAETASAPQPTMGRRALLGDILLAMGALSIMDMEKSLAEFDPKVDGRFGGFLIRRNLINEAQLEAALLQQQLNNEANAFQPDDAPLPDAAETPAPVEAPKPVETTMSMSLKTEEDEPKKIMLPDLEFEPPAMDLQKLNKSPESDKS